MGAALSSRVPVIRILWTVAFPRHLTMHVHLIPGTGKYRVAES